MIATTATEKPSRGAPVKDAMTIRDARESDLPAIVRIYNAAIATRVSTAQLEPVTLEDRRHWLKDHSSDRHPFWVLELNGQVAGWLTLKTFIPRGAYRDTAEVSVYVDEKFRRRGVGRALLAEAIGRAPELGIAAMVGLIFAHNPASLQLFAQLGFEKWGLLPGVARLDGVERDLTIMGWQVGRRDQTSSGPTTRWTMPPGSEIKKPLKSSRKFSTSSRRATP
jgi:L-amino acid N-acyltransferase YncA